MQYLNQLRRKFVGQKIPSPSHREAQAVGAPIKQDRLAHMDDTHWLDAIGRYSTDNEWRRDPDYIAGGESLLAFEL